MAGSINIGGILTGTTSGTEYIGPFTLPATSTGNFQVQNIAPSTSSVFAFTVPTWAQTLIIAPPSGNAIGINFYGGASGNTPFAISPNLPSLFSFPGGSSENVFLAAASAFPSTSPIVFILT